MNTRKKILCFLIHNPNWHNPCQIAKATDISIGSVYPQLYALRDNEKIIQRKEGRFTKYIINPDYRNPKLKNLEETSRSIKAHNLHIHYIFSKLQPQGGCNRPSSLQDQETVLNDILQYYLGEDYNLEDYAPWWESTTSISGEYDVEKDHEGTIVRTIFFRIAWGRNTIAKRGAPTFYLRLKCSKSPVDDLAILLLLFSEIRYSFNLDPFAAEMRFKQYGINKDIPLSDFGDSIKAQLNSCNISLKVARNIVFQNYPKVIDGKEYIRKEAHLGNDEGLPLDVFYRLVQDVGEVSVLAKMQEETNNNQLVINARLKSLENNINRLCDVINKAVDINEKKKVIGSEVFSPFS